MDASLRDPVAIECIVIDGGTGSELQRRGIPVHPICWHATAAISDPKILTETHRDFIRAGAGVITANTFATHRYVLAAAGLSEHYQTINTATMKAAHDARASFNGKVRIAASMSCLPPAFDTRSYPSARTAIDTYQEHAHTLADLGADLLATEMLQDTKHSLWLLEAAIGTGLPVWLGLSCRLNPDNELVCYDDPARALSDVILPLLATGPAVVNIMHTPIEAVPTAVELIRQNWSGPIGVYPELGSFDAVTRIRTPQVTPADFAAASRNWQSKNVAVIGGCCGATPAHINALSASLPN